MEGPFFPFRKGLSIRIRENQGIRLIHEALQGNKRHQIGVVRSDGILVWKADIGLKAGIPGGPDDQPGCFVCKYKGRAERND